MEGETWKEIAGFEGLYAISNLGNIRSLAKCNPANGYCWPERPMKLHDLKGYLVVWLRRPGGVHKKFFVHQLVAAAFFESDPGRPFVNHKDKDRTNNAVDNLELCTHQENIYHRDNYQKPVCDMEF